MVQRLAKGVLPPNTQIQKDAVTAMSKGATVFVNHIADKYVQLPPFPKRNMVFGSIVHPSSSAFAIRLSFPL